MQAARTTGAVWMLAAAVLAGGCGWGQRYEDEGQGYVIRFPKGWTVKPDAQGLVTAFAPRQDPNQFQTFFTVRMHGLGKDIDAKLFRDRQMYEESTVVDEQTGQAVYRLGFNKVIEQGETTLAGHDAAWSLYSMNIGQMEVYAMSWFVTDSTGRGFHLTGVTSVEQFEEIRPLFEQVIGTLKILPQAEKV